MKIRFLTSGILSTFILVTSAAFGMDENEEFNNKRFPYQHQISSKILKKRSRYGDFTKNKKIKDICEKHKLLTELNVSDSEEVTYSNRNNDEIDYLTSDIKIRKNSHIKKYDIQIKMNDDSIKKDNTDPLLLEIDRMLKDLNNKEDHSSKKINFDWIEINNNDDLDQMISDNDNINHLIFEIDGMLNDLNNKGNYSSSKVKQLIKTFNTKEDEQRVETNVSKKIIKNKPSLYISNLMHKFQPVDNN